MIAAPPLRLFISYAHKNEAAKDRLLGHLKLLKRSGLIGTWDNREIPAGAAWREAIDEAMAAADVAVFLLDEYFLASDFCMDVEVDGFLERHRQGELLILFVLTDHCGWKELSFISRFQMLPRDAKPITSFRPQSRAYTAVLEEIKQALLLHRQNRRAAMTRAAVPKAAAPSGGALNAVLARLPGRTDHLFGRDAELRQLTDWQVRKGVFLWVAPGGMGPAGVSSRIVASPPLPWCGGQG